jgi:Family of unknown function (DUF6221)
MTITEFLEARITEEEVLARRVAERTEYAPPNGIGGVGNLGIVGYPFARVLAECAAKRKIVEAHPIESGSLSDFTDCGTCLDVDTYDAYPCLTLRLLALPDADHPDYRTEWSV